MSTRARTRARERERERGRGRERESYRTCSSRTSERERARGEPYQEMLKPYQEMFRTGIRKCCVTGDQVTGRRLVTHAHTRTYSTHTHAHAPHSDAWTQGNIHTQEALSLQGERESLLIIESMCLWRGTGARRRRG